MCGRPAVRRRSCGGTCRRHSASSGSSATRRLDEEDRLPAGDLRQDAADRRAQRCPEHARARPHVRGPLLRAARARRAGRATSRRPAPPPSAWTQRPASEHGERRREPARERRRGEDAQPRRAESRERPPARGVPPGTAPAASTRLYDDQHPGDVGDRSRRSATGCPAAPASPPTSRRERSRPRGRAGPSDWREARTHSTAS